MTEAIPRPQHNSYPTMPSATPRNTQYDGSTTTRLRTRCDNSKSRVNANVNLSLIQRNSCIHNLFIYCSSAWGNCSNYLSSRLLLLQKRAARLLLDTDYSQPSVSLFSKLKWLPIFDLIKLRKLVLFFTILNNSDAPLCLQRKFNFLSSVRSTGLRTRACAFNLQIPYPRSNSEKRTFAYSAAYDCRFSLYCNCIRR